MVLYDQSSLTSSLVKLDGNKIALKEQDEQKKTHCAVSSSVSPVLSAQFYFHHVLYEMVSRMNAFFICRMYDYAVSIRRQIGTRVKKKMFHRAFFFEKILKVELTSEMLQFRQNHSDR